jgi:hypothetical protein
MTVPKRVFIVPYRNRHNQKIEFTKKIKTLLEDEAESNPYEIYFAHQCDNRHFNRGAMKNIGFIAIKNKYPNDYKNITFIFHDVDTWPVEKGLIDYNTTHGIVKHFYGFKHALGGMFAIKGADFEKSQGFPNFWGWGLEDNIINDRCIKAGLTIDRSNFYGIHDKKIARPFDGFERIISKRDSTVYKYETPDNLNSISNLKYTFVNEYININEFKCEMVDIEQDYISYDIRKGNHIKVPKGYFRRPWSMSSILR